MGTMGGNRGAPAPYPYPGAPYPGAPYPEEPKPSYQSPDWSNPTSSMYSGPTRPNPIGVGAKDEVAETTNVAWDFGPLQWMRQMQGLQGALGEYDPAAYYAKWMANQGPGQMEEWFKNYGGMFMNPSASEGALGSYSDYMKYGPKYGQTGANEAKGEIRQHRGDDYWQSTAKDAYSKPGTYEDWYQQNQLQYTRPSQATEVFDKHSGQLATPGRSEQLQLEEIRRMANFADTLQGRQGANRTDQASGEVGGYYRGASDVSDYARSQMGAIRGPGTYEQFVNADIYGNNPAMARAKDQGLARINQEMARRGSFKSGSADTAIGNFLGEMEAREYDQRAQRAQSAQQMQMQRIGTGQALTTASGQQKLAQGGALLGLGQARDAESRFRLDQQMKAEEGASKEGLAMQDLLLKAAGQADASQLARLQGLQGMATASDEGWMGVLKMAQDAAGAAQDATEKRVKGGVDATSGLDKSALDRADQLYKMGMGLDKQNLDLYDLLGKLSGQKDDHFLKSLLGMGGMAGNAQDAQQGRYGDAFGALFGVGNAKAGHYGDFYGQGGEFSGRAFNDYINMVLARKGFHEQGKQNKWDNWLGAASVPVNAYAASKGG